MYLGRRLGENKIVAVVLLLPKPRTVLALVNDLAESSQRVETIPKYELTLVPKVFEKGENVADGDPVEVTVLALENQKR